MDDGNRFGNPSRTIWAGRRHASRTAKIDVRMHERILHPLKGFKPTCYSVHVNGPWCITFEFDNGDALRVDFEQYH